MVLKLVMLYGEAVELFRKWSFTGASIPGFEVYGLNPLSVLFYCFLYVDENVTS